MSKSETITISVNAGAQNNRAYGAFAVVHNGKLAAISPEKAGTAVGKDKIARIQELKNLSTPNQAFYGTLAYAARYAYRVQKESKKPLHFQFRLSNALVVKQVTGEWKIKDPNLVSLHDHAMKFLALIKFSIVKS